MQRFSGVGDGRFHGSANDLLWHALNAALICDLTSAPRNERTKGSEGEKECAREREREREKEKEGKKTLRAQRSTHLTRPLSDPCARLASLSLSLSLSFYIFLAASCFTWSPSLSYPPPLLITQECFIWMKYSHLSTGTRDHKIK